MITFLFVDGGEWKALPSEGNRILEIHLERQNNLLNEYLVVRIVKKVKHGNTHGPHEKAKEIIFSLRSIYSLIHQCLRQSHR